MYEQNQLSWRYCSQTSGVMSIRMVSEWAYHNKRLMRVLGLELSKEEKNA
jgi:hypothetical protein